MKKIKSAYKKREPVKVRLSYAAISGNGNHKILLNETQKKKFDKSMKHQKGLELEMNYDQLKINHSGGFLPLIFAGMGALGALLGGGAAVASSVIESKHKTAEEAEITRHNLEMERLAQNAKSLSIGSGLKKAKSKKKQKN